MERKISWVKAALKDFGGFPEPVQRKIVAALRFAAKGEKAETAKPGNHRFEPPRRSAPPLLSQGGEKFHNLYRRTIDPIVERLKRLKEQLR